MAIFFFFGSKSCKHEKGKSFFFSFFWRINEKAKALGTKCYGKSVKVAKN